MAGESIQHRDSDLVRQLQLRYGMPTEHWWEGAKQKYSQLCMLLNNQSDDLESNWKPHEDASEDAARARQESLPSISVLPIGTYNLRLAATDEDLECVVFGTVRDLLFIDLLLEAIGQAPEKGISVVVHELKRLPTPKVVLGIGSQTFGVTYFQCEELVRK